MLDESSDRRDPQNPPATIPYPTDFSTTDISSPPLVTGAAIDGEARSTIVDHESQRTEAEGIHDARVTVLDTRIAETRPSAKPGFGLSDPEPWDEPVDGARALDELAQTVARHVILSEAARDAVALWVMHAHAHDSAAISPLLSVTSPTPECGKSTLAVTLLGALVPRPLPTSNITPATLFRAVAKWSPTLLIDEADTFLGRSDELRGIINSGHTRAGGFTLRSVGDQHEPTIFPTWSPKCIACIGKLPPTLASRSIHIQLRRISPTESIAPLRGDRLGHLGALQRRCWRWSRDHRDELSDADPSMPPTLRSRSADNWRHLLAIADLAGGEWPERARKAAVTLSAGVSEQTAGIMLLQDICDVFKLVDRISSADLVAALVKRDDRPWSEWKGKPITQPRLARELEPFGIRPKQLRFPNGRAGISGYRAEQFVDAFARYVAVRSSTPLQATVSMAPDPIAASTEEDRVEDRDPPETNNGAGCRAVEDEVTEARVSGWNRTL